MITRRKTVIARTRTQDAYIRALEKSEMVRIKSADFYKLGQKPVGQIIIQISAETSFIDKQQQQIELPPGYQITAPNKRN